MRRIPRATQAPESTHTDDYKWTYPAYACEYCHVCENRGFTHGACLRCARLPRIQVTTIGNEDEDDFSTARIETTNLLTKGDQR